MIHRSRARPRHGASSAVTTFGDRAITYPSLVALSMYTPLWNTEFGDEPVVACAIHDGHYIRQSVAEIVRLSDTQRRYEEDPFTASWTSLAHTRIIGLRSRFEFDLNRPRDKAVYLTSEDAWGLEVWKTPPPTSLVEDLLRGYDDFYAHLHLLLERLVARHQRVVVFDLHSYNHGRDGADRPLADPNQNPEINLGTGSMDRVFWKAIVECALDEMRVCEYLGRRLDVRENVRFQGGHMVQWIHANFPRQVCGLAIEVKKFFMNEWTGQVDERQLAAIGTVLTQAATGVLGALENWNDGRRAH